MRLGSGMPWAQIGARLAEYSIQALRRVTGTMLFGVFILCSYGSVACPGPVRLLADRLCFVVSPVQGVFHRPITPKIWNYRLERGLNHIWPTPNVSWCRPRS